MELILCACYVLNVTVEIIGIARILYEIKFLYYI